MDTPTEGQGPLSRAERRSWDRLPIAIPFFMHGRKSNGQEFLEFTTALNISAGGVLLATKRFLEPNTQVSLEVPTALYHKAHLPQSVSLFHATVLRCIPDPRCFLLGLRFEKPLIAGSSDSETIRPLGNTGEDHNAE
jgi:hypothetical protein